MRENVLVRAVIVGMALTALKPSTTWAQSQSAPVPTNAKGEAPIDLTGYWVSQIVDEWRFRVKPEKGDIPFLPLNAEGRRIAAAWDPGKDIAENNACRAYGAVGVMQRPGRLHIAWQDNMTLKVDADAGTQTRLFHFGPAMAQKGEASLQGYSAAQWVVNGRPMLFTGDTLLPGLNPQSARSGTLRVTTTNLLPGYLRKNGVPYSKSAVLNEYFNLLGGQNGDAYFVVTAMLEDQVYLTQPFIRTYAFKKQPDASGWDPTACLPR
jgi:hypothetical protein